jgi:hypothetical protein
MAQSTMGWSDARRRDEMRRLVDAVQARYECSRIDAVTIIANRTGSAVNTVQGWLSEVTELKGKRPRSAPPWTILDILRYELGESDLMDLRHFLPSKKRKSARA